MARRGRGRPPKDEASKRSEQITFRVSATLRERLELASTEANRSISTEIEGRLRESFEIDKRFGGPFMYGLLRVLVERIRIIESEDGEARWFTSRWTYDDVKALVDEVFEHFRPRGAPRAPKRPSLKKWRPGELGRHMGRLALAELEDAMRAGDGHAPPGFVNPYLAARDVVPRMRKSALAGLLAEHEPRVQNQRRTK